MPLNEGRSLNPGDTAVAPAMRSFACTAQRRPEPEPRRHSRAPPPPDGTRSLNEGRSLNPGDTKEARYDDRSRRHPLNEGRSLNPGDTPTRMTNTSVATIAQRRPEPEPRRHTLSASPSSPLVTIAQRRPEPEPRRHRSATTVTISETAAQRRPEPEPRRHRKRCARSAFRRASLNEGRSLNPGDTVRV